jgi:hypothetical protein
MHELRARIHVNADRVITGVAPPEVPPGEHEITITVTPSRARRRPRKSFDVNDLPEHDLGPWPEGLSLRREDLYDEDGR